MTPPEADRPWLVLGAGCAGLAAAWRLVRAGKPVTLVEAQDHAGGLAGGVRIGGDVYEYGPHVFHTTDPELLSDIRGLLGPELLPYTRTIQIKFMGEFFRFPLALRDVALKLPWKTVAWAGLTLLWRRAQGLFRRPARENSETVLLRSYGDVLYRLFFKDYIERVWGIPPAAFSPSFARERIPRLNILELLDKAAEAVSRPWRRGAPVRTRGYVETVAGQLYTTREGYSLIARKLAERLERAGCRVLFNTRVERLLREGDAVTGVVVRDASGERVLPCAAALSTLPINEAAAAFEPGLGEAAVAAAARLRFRAIVFVGLKVRRTRVLPASFMYFREHSFNRITDFSHFSFRIEPPGRTLLVAEVTCDPADPIWTDEAMAREAVIADLEREGLLARDEIEAAHVFRSRHAHPMYTLGYEESLTAVLEAFSRLRNFETAGRQGRFQYVNTHVALKMGAEAAERLLSR